MKKILLFFVAALSAVQLSAQVMQYSADLIHTENDQVAVQLICPTIADKVLNFNFPKTIPGTYAVEDYGKYIADFKAVDANGVNLNVKKIGENTFQISNADKLYKITYKVNDSFDSGIKKNAIFEPAGTTIEHNKCVLVNACGFFGYFEGKEMWPIVVDFAKPANLYGATVLPSVLQEGAKASYKAENYHELVDKPILFAAADTVSFKVQNTRVNIAVFNQTGDSNTASKVYGELKASMEAISQYLPSLPVSNYSFLIYVVDYRKIGEIITKPNLSISNIIKIIRSVGGKGFGALEHGNSSVYYLPEFGIPALNVPSQMKDVAIHEFMHIVTPLSLHSQHIGNFNYTKPVMSKHLWLYEGSTEYAAGLIQLRGKLLSTKDYLQKTLRSKVLEAEKFPYQSMAFTEMSANVINEKKYKKQYTQVYQRGAVLSLLLDLEIIRLTDGKKTLRDVKQTLAKRYGAHKSFNEDTFIQEFVAEVHPDLQNFFNSYIEGKQKIDYNKYLNIIGVAYTETKDVMAPRDPIAENDVKIPKLAVNVSNTITVKSIGKKEWAGLQVGDELEKNYYDQYFKTPEGKYLPEGTVVNMKIVRNGNKMALPIKILNTKKTLKYQFEEKQDKNEQQKRYFQLWSSN